MQRKGSRRGAWRTYTFPLKNIEYATVSPMVRSSGTPAARPYRGHTGAEQVASLTPPGGNTKPLPAKVAAALEKAKAAPTEDTAGEPITWRTRLLNPLRPSLVSRQRPL